MPLLNGIYFHIGLFVFTKRATATTGFRVTRSHEIFTN